MNTRHFGVGTISKETWKLLLHVFITALCKATRGSVSMTVRAALTTHCTRSSSTKIQMRRGGGEREREVWHTSASWCGHLLAVLRNATVAPVMLSVQDEWTNNRNKHGNDQTATPECGMHHPCFLPNGTESGREGEENLLEISNAKLEIGRLMSGVSGNTALCRHYGITIKLGWVEAWSHLKCQWERWIC